MIIPKESPIFRKVELSENNDWRQNITILVRILWLITYNDADSNDGLKAMTRRLKQQNKFSVLRIPYSISHLNSNINEIKITNTIYWLKYLFFFSKTCLPSKHLANTVSNMWSTGFV